MISKHYNINQLRVDLWNELKEQSNLITFNIENDSFEERLTELNGIMQNLLCIEQYFAFPGADLTNQIIKAVKKSEFVAVSHRVSEIVALLVSEDYRTHPELKPEFFESIKDNKNKKKLDAKSNFFEVLYVEDLSDNEEKELKKKKH